MRYLRRMRMVQWGLNTMSSILNSMGQDYEQIQYFIETNDKLKINLVLDVLSYLDTRELKLVKQLIDVRIAVLKGDK